MELSPEEKKKIYEEEKAKAEAKAEAEVKKKKTSKTALGCLTFILIGVVAVIIFSLKLEKESKPPAPKTQQELRKEKIEKPDPNLQVERENFLDGLDNIHIGFKLPRSSGIDAVVGAAWYDLSYEAKEKYASVAAAWALCKYYEDQDFYVVRFRDYRTDKEVATLSLSATRGASFKVK